MASITNKQRRAAARARRQGEALCLAKDLLARLSKTSYFELVIALQDELAERLLFAEMGAFLSERKKHSTLIARLFCDYALVICNQIEANMREEKCTTDAERALFIDNFTVDAAQ